MNPGRVSVRLVGLALLSLATPWLRGRGMPAEVGAGPAGGAAVVSQGLVAPREEFFVLEEPIEAGPAPDLEGGPSLEMRAVGLAIARRLDVDAGHQLEWDILFPDQGTRVLHVESWGAAGTRLIWRELRPGSGRSLSATWLEDGDGLHLREWAGRSRRVETIVAPGGGLFPLHLLELARGSSIATGSVRSFDPLSRSFETLRVRVTPAPDAGDPGRATPVRRRVDLEREDGTSAGSWVFEGEHLLALRWQAGGLRARRITAQEYDQRLRAEEESEPARGEEPASQ